MLKKKKAAQNKDSIIINQIKDIRHIGMTNMFDVEGVKFICKNLKYYELYEYIESDSNRYIRSILSGKVYL